MTQHAMLSASAAHRWMLCPGSSRLSKGIERTSTRNAAEGTFAHEIAAATLNRVQPVESWLGKKRIVDDKFEIECDQPMIDAVKFYVEEIQDELLPEDNQHVEVDLTKALTKLHPALGGTADFVRYRPSKKHLRVIDLKYGAGVLVEAEGNLQAQVYALGALLSTSEPCSQVTVTIIQPRAEHPDGRVRDWTFPSGDLLDFAADLVAAAEAAEKPDAPLVPGAEQCKWCPAKPICPALEAQQHALTAVEFDGTVALTPAKLAQALDFIPAVKARIKAIEETAYQMAESGVDLPGYKLVDKRPTRQWLRDGDVIEWADKNAIDLYAPRELLSPAQAEKKLGENAPKGKKKEAGKVLEQFVVKVSSGHVLVAMDDDRPPAKLISAADFSVTDGTEENNVARLFND